MAPNSSATTRLAILTGVLALALHSAAAEPVQELLFVELPYAQEAGEVQVTLGTSLMAFDAASESEFVPVLEYGVTHRFQATLELPYASLDARGQTVERGLGDVEAELLYNILADDSPVLLSVGWGIGLPTGNEDVGLDDGELTMEPSLRVGKHVGKSMVYGAFAGELNGEETALHYGVAAVYSVGHWRPSLELSGAHSDDGEPWYFVPGLTRTGIGDFELAIGSPVGLTDDAADWGVAAMLTYEFSTRQEDE